MIFAYFEYLGYKSRFYGVMVSTLDFESSDPSSNLGRTFMAICITYVILRTIHLMDHSPEMLYAAVAQWTSALDF